MRAHAKASSFRRREKLAELHVQAQAQVHALKRELAEDAGASARRKQAAAERAAREREQRLAAALVTMDKLQRKPVPEAKKPKPATRAQGQLDIALEVWLQTTAMCAAGDSTVGHSPRGP